MAVPAHGADPEALDRLEKIIERQQVQIEAQQKALEDLRKHVEELTVAEGKSPAEPSSEKSVAVTAEKLRSSLELYGQVNKAVLFCHDGNDENTYLVDNDNTSTRVGLLGSLAPDVSYKIGTRIEVEYQTNPSNRVSQVDERIGDTDFEKRHLDLFLDSRRFGKLALG